VASFFIMYRRLRDVPVVHDLEALGRRQDALVDTSDPFEAGRGVLSVRPGNRPVTDRLGEKGVDLFSAVGGDAPRRT